MSLAPLLAVTIALFAVLRFWTYRPRTGGVIRPGARFGQRRWAGINVIDCQTMGGSAYCRLGSAASSFGVAQRHGRIQSAKCLIRPVSF